MEGKFSPFVCGTFRPLHSCPTAELQPRGHPPPPGRRGAPLCRMDEFVFLSHRQHDSFKRDENWTSPQDLIFRFCRDRLISVACFALHSKVHHCPQVFGGHTLLSKFLSPFSIVNRRANDYFKVIYLFHVILCKCFHVSPSVQRTLGYVIMTFSGWHFALGSSPVEFSI